VLLSPGRDGVSALLKVFRSSIARPTDTADTPRPTTVKSDSSFGSGALAYLCVLACFQRGTILELPSMRGNFKLHHYPSFSRSDASKFNGCLLETNGINHSVKQMFPPDSFQQNDDLVYQGSANGVEPADDRRDPPAQERHLLQKPVDLALILAIEAHVIG